MDALFQEINIHLAQLYGRLAGLRDDASDYNMWLGIIQ